MGKFAVNDRVAERKNLRATYSFSIGTIISIIADGRIVVEWYSAGSGHVEIFPEDELVSESEANSIHAALNAVEAKLEAEFELLKPKFEEKVDAAIVLVKEARQIARDCHKDFQECKDLLRPLFSLMKEYGWSSSSISC